MDIQIRKQLEQLEYIKDKLEYIEYDEALGCYIEKQDGLPTGVAAWVNGAFYGFEQAAKAQAVPDGFVLMPMVPSERMINAVRQCYEGEAYLPYSLYSEFVNQAIIERMEAQEQAMTEITIRCTNCGLEFESDYDLEQNLVDQETGEIHDGCPTCKTDAYLMDLIKYPD